MEHVADDITRYSAFAVQKYALDDIIQGFTTAAGNHATDENNGLRTFGMCVYENPRNRLLNLAAQADNPIETATVGSPYPHIALNHAVYGTIVLHLHIVDRNTFVPKPHAARKAKSQATPAPHLDLFNYTPPAVHHRLVGLVGNETEGLLQIVVGELVRVHHKPERFELTKRITIFDAWMGGPSMLPPLDVGPPEPDVTPSVSIVRHTDGETKTGEA